MQIIPDYYYQNASKLTNLPTSKNTNLDYGSQIRIKTFKSDGADVEIS